MQKFQQTIAEVSKKQKKLIKCAKVNGADAVKLQTYTADMMTLKSNKKILSNQERFMEKDIIYGTYIRRHIPH